MSFIAVRRGASRSGGLELSLFLRWAWAFDGTWLNIRRVVEGRRRTCRRRGLWPGQRSQHDAALHHQFSIPCRYILYSVDRSPPPPILRFSIGMEIKFLQLVQMERPRPAAAENHGLAACFIHHSIALQPARARNRLAFAWVTRDQFWIRPRAKSLRARDRIGRN